MFNRRKIIVHCDIYLFFFCTIIKAEQEIFPPEQIWQNATNRLKLARRKLTPKHSGWFSAKYAEPTLKTIVMNTDVTRNRTQIRQTLEETESSAVSDQNQQTQKTDRKRQETPNQSKLTEDTRVD